MKAMVLAAGLGTRLGKITASKPKALVEVEGIPLIEHVILRLKKHRFTEIIINVHHFTGQIIDFIESRNSFGLHIDFSQEKELLDTGGGLKNASWFFDSNEPFLLQNVDILSDLDLTAFMQFHIDSESLATVAVRQRETQRYILFDENNQLVGWESLQTGEKIISRPGKGEISRLSFMGIHAFSPKIFAKMKDDGAFSIIKTYLKLAEDGGKITGYRGDSARWLDLGRIEVFQQARMILGDDFFTENK
ncbi:MAG: nucleotidyltransferase family protein [Calditrichaeota bacterium]|nr:MAG: nucleotidyltransferase family protein [Calditrichota bacterium]